MTDDTFESRLSWEKQVEFCLYKLSENGAYPISLGCVSRYQSPAEVPLEQRDKLTDRMLEENTDDVRITWADFRQMVAQAVDELAKEGGL